MPRRRYPVPSDELQKVIDKFELTHKDMEQLFVIQGSAFVCGSVAVSYTHLTLPTIYSV